MSLFVLVRILLVNASFHIKADIVGDNAMIQPMGVAYLAAYLRSKGVEVFVYEPSVMGGKIEDHYSRIKGYDCEVIGFSLCADEYRKETFSIIEMLRNDGNKGFVVMGGHSPSLNYETYLDECKGIDCISIGEGEITLCELIMCLASKRDWRLIRGIAYRDVNNGKVVRTEPRELIQNIDIIPFPARDVLASRVKYVGEKAVAYILSSRGCYQNCSFCSVATYYNLQCGNRFRYRSVLNIVEEILSINKEFGITRFSFIDDNFVLPGQAGIERCEEFNRLIKNSGIKFSFEINTRVDTIQYESIRYLREVGLRNICIGIESFLESDLKIYNKNITRNQIETALAILENLGYSTKVGSEYRIRTYMIVFNPYTTIDGLLEHLTYMKKYHISPKKMITILTVYDHTDIKNQLLRDNLLYGKNKWHFKYKFMDLIYEYFSKYTRLTMEKREKVRTLQKYVMKMQYEVNDDVLNEIREHLDESCYDFLERLLVTAEHIGGREGFINEFDTAIKRMREYVLQRFNDITISEIERDLHIDLDNLYIYDDL